MIKNERIKNSPVKEVFRISIPQDKQDSAGRMSWDETAVLIVAKGYQPYYTLTYGKMIVADDGSNTWSADGEQHAYLVEKIPFQEVKKEIEKLIQHQPVKSLAKKNRK